MILTPRMWKLKQRIDFLEQATKADPTDRAVSQCLRDLKRVMGRLERIEALGLKLVLGGKHPSQAKVG